MSEVANWKHKDEWKRSGKNFSMVISRHEEKFFGESSGCYDSEGPHRWCIYVYIYPSHPRFGTFVGNAMWQDATNVGFHGGCSFFRRHVDEKGIATSIQIGCDYHHDGDWSYTQMANASDAQSVFHDAEEIFERISGTEEQS